MNRLLLIALSAATVSFGAASPNSGSEQVNKLLTETRVQAVALQNDAVQLLNWAKFTHEVSWASHAEKLEEMRIRVNKAGKLVHDLQNCEIEGSPWQQTAIKRIYPALREMADNLQKTIDQLSANKNNTYMSPYTDLAEANADLAENLAQTITDFVNYGRARGNMDELREKLEVPKR